MPVIKLDKIIKYYCNPYKTSVWADISAPVSIRDVQHYIAQNRFFKEPLQARFYNKTNHTARIAYLAKNGWIDPIEICKLADRWQVTNGNHRLAAAIYNRQHSMNVKFY